MTAPAETKRILITVKTYPNPSSTYEETVCTAGIDLETGKFIRLYPVRFRDLDYDKWFSKWDVVEAVVRHKTSDGRGDTYTPEHESFKVVGHMKTGSKRHPDWRERNELVLPLVSTLEELIDRANKKECSLGIVRLVSDVKFTAVADDADWTDDQKAILTRDHLFGRSRSPLQKVPWKFHFAFRCSDQCHGHKLQVFDWEAYQLYRQQAVKKGAELAVQDVLHQYNTRLGWEKRDLHLFVGTHFLRQEQFTGIGVYYPPRVSASG